MARGYAVMEVLDSIGWGKYQLRLICLLSGVWISNGAQFLLFSTLVQSVATEFGLGENVTKAGLAAVAFGGLCIGCVLSGALGDEYGRRPVCIASYGLITFAGFSMLFTKSLATVYAARLLIGFGAGLGLPAILTLTLESSPRHMRVPLSIGLNSLLSLGGAWSACGLYLFVPHLVGNHWRLVVAWGAIPAAFLLFPAFLYLTESPQWLYVHREEKRLTRMLLHARELNDAYTADISMDHNEAVQNQDRGRALGRFQELFKQEYRWTTASLACIAFVTNFVMFGQSYVLTRELIKTAASGEPAIRLLGCVTCEFLGVLLLVCVVVEVPQVGSPQGLASLLSCCGVCCVALFSVDYDVAQKVFLPAAYALRFCAAATIALAYTFIPEMFPSEIRNTGTGVCLSFGRLGTIIAPLVYEALHVLVGSDVLFLSVGGLACTSSAFLALRLGNADKMINVPSFLDPKGYQKLFLESLRDPEQESAPLLGQESLSQQ